MSKKTIDMVALTADKANAQHMTCFVTFLVTSITALFMMIFACAFPALVGATEIVCWISMFLEALALVLGYAAFWIYKNAL